MRDMDKPLADSARVMLLDLLTLLAETDPRETTATLAKMMAPRASALELKAISVLVAAELRLALQGQDDAIRQHAVESLMAKLRRAMLR